MDEGFMNKVLKQVLSVLSNAVVFLDDNVAECLHWHNGFGKLINAGALEVRNIHEEKDYLESETKAVFMISSPLCGRVSHRIEHILKANDFQHATVICTISAAIHEFISSMHSGISNTRMTFGEFSRSLKIWMQNDYATADVRHVPLFYAQILPDLFVTPVHSDLFSILPSDVARLQGFLHSKGDKRIFNAVGDIDISLLPQNLQVQLKMLASSLNDMFDMQSINEDCYGVGHFSKLLASELANLPNAKARRKMATKRASIVFVDRMLDLVGPTSYNSNNLLDTIMEVLFKLPGHHNDVAINMELLFANGNKTPETLLPGCLAHADDPVVTDILNSFTMEQSKDALKMLQEKLTNALNKEKIAFENLDDKPILVRLRHLLSHFRENVKLFQKYGGLLQCTLAAVNALTDLDLAHREEVLSAEKVIMLELFDSDSSRILSRIQSLLTKDSSRFTVVDILLLCLHFYSAVGETWNIDPGQEEKLKEAINHVLMDGNHSDDLLFLLGHDDPSEREVRLRIADVFERLRGIGRVRSEQRQIRSLVSRRSGGQVSYHSMLSQLVQLIYDPDQPELIDIEFRSHGLKDFIKTGFGLFMNVKKPRPDDHNLLYLFVVGGITFNEVRQIRETLTHLNVSSQVVIGSTRIISPTDILEQVLCNENLFVDLE